MSQIFSSFHICVLWNRASISSSSSGSGSGSGSSSSSSNSNSSSRRRFYFQQNTIMKQEQISVSTDIKALLQSVNGHQWSRMAHQAGNKAVRRLILRSRGVSKLRDCVIRYPNCFEVWQVAGQHCCRATIQISQPFDNRLSRVFL